MMTQDNGFLRDQIQRHSEARQRLDEAHRRASSDAATGLFNPGVGESYLRLKLEDRQRVTAFMLDAGDTENSLQRVSQVLAEHSAAFEMICRWHGRRFLLITSADIRPGEMLAQIKRGLKTDNIPGVRFAIARSEPGDNVQKVIAKLEDQLKVSSTAAAAHPADANR